VLGEEEKIVPLGWIGEAEASWRQTMEREARVERMEVVFILG